LEQHRATGGLAPVPGWLSGGEVLSHFGQRRGAAQDRYREYVSEGIGGQTIWEDVEAQSLLGMEGFAEALKDHVSGKRAVREIPRGQRLMGRTALKKLFDGCEKEKAKRDRLIAEAVFEHGYSQIEVTRQLKLHYSTVSRLIKALSTAHSKNKDLTPIGADPNRCQS
jgi:putative transposase